MARKEKKSRVGNNSLLQTARTKNALLSPNSAETGHSRPHVLGHNDGANWDYPSGGKQDGGHSKSFFSLWPTSSNNAVDDHHRRHNQERKNRAITNRRMMEINKEHSAPMNLNQYHPQMGGEKTMSGSKERREIHTRMIQKQEEARFTIEERLKQTFEMEEINHYRDYKVNSFCVDNRAAAVNTILQKKTLMKKVLGKVRQKPMNQLQQSQEKSSAIQAAMAAAAAAVEAATGNPNGRRSTGVNQTSGVSRQKGFHFPVNEVTMNPNEDSVSDLDTSLKNTRKLPVLEIHTSNSRNFDGDESVSTLGTPRMFEELQYLQRSQHQPGLIPFFEDDVGRSGTPRQMVTSRDARALIDQIDSGTLVGDMTIGTARAENAIQFCNIASNCFRPSGRACDSENSAKKNEPNAELWTSTNPAFTQAIDDAIRKAEIQIATNHTKSQPDQTSNLNSFGEIKFRDVTQTKGTKRDNRGIPSKRRTNKTRDISERVLLEKDDAYWDTLSTIASTANDQSTKSDHNTDDSAQPSPIPGEIMTPSGETKSDSSPRSNQNVEDSFSQQGGHLQEILNDVTDLIDSNLLDNLPVSKNRKRSTEIFSSAEKASNAIGRSETSSVANLGKKTTLSHQTRLRPEGVSCSKHEQKRSGNLTTAASHIAKGLRSVSWGFEEINEEKETFLNESNEGTANSSGSGSSRSVTRTPRPFPEGLHRDQRIRALSGEQYPRVQEDLLSRTLELSKGLLETIMGGQLEQEDKLIEEPQEIDANSNISREMQSDDIHFIENQTSTESRDDFHPLEKVREDDFSPTINSRLQSLRNQRSRALTKFRQSQLQMAMSMPSRSGKADGEKRDRERLMSKSYDYGRYSRNAEYSTRNKIAKQRYREHFDIDIVHTMSNTSTTPSQKARNLRMQVDQAMRTSREIQLSQNELGNELNGFKSRYYKTPEKRLYGF